MPYIGQSMEQATYPTAQSFLHGLGRGTRRGSPQGTPWGTPWNASNPVVLHLPRGSPCFNRRRVHRVLTGGMRHGRACPMGCRIWDALCCTIGAQQYVLALFSQLLLGGGASTVHRGTVVQYPNIACRYNRFVAGLRHYSIGHGVCSLGQVECDIYFSEKPVAG